MEILRKLKTFLLNFWLCTSNLLRVCWGCNCPLDGNDLTAYYVPGNLICVQLLYSVILDKSDLFKHGQMFPAIWSQQGTCVLGTGDGTGDALAIPSTSLQPEDVRSPLCLCPHPELSGTWTGSNLCYSCLLWLCQPWLYMWMLPAKMQHIQRCSHVLRMGTGNPNQNPFVPDALRPAKHLV